MKQNYSLTTAEVGSGLLLLTCQAIPTIPRLIVDFDAAQTRRPNALLPFTDRLQLREPASGEGRVEAIPEAASLVTEVASQRIDQPAQQQTVILDDLQQRIRPRLPAISIHHQRRRPKLSVKQRDLIGCSRRLTQSLKLSGIQHELAGYRGPQPNTLLS